MLWLKELPTWDVFPSAKPKNKDHPLIQSSDDCGIQSFYSVRLATSNAKQTAYYLQRVFDMDKVAHRGLETGSRFFASHVLKRNNVVFEVMAALETKTDMARHKTTEPSLVAKSEVSSSSTDCSVIQRRFLDVAGESKENRVFINEALRYSAVTKSLGLGSSEPINKENIISLVGEANMASFLTSFVSVHGMGVFDIVFKVENLEKVFNRAVAAGAEIVTKPYLLKDVNGSVMIATVGTPVSDLRHTLVEVIDYNGPYLPEYASVKGIVGGSCETSSLLDIDHCVQNFSWNQLEPSAEFYIAAFGFHKFWSVDDRDVSTGNSGLRSIVLSSSNNEVKMPMNEPAEHKMRGQIEEFCDYYAGPGVQHIAMRTNDIVALVTCLRARGIEFNTISDEYYVGVEKRLKLSAVELYEDFKVLKQNHILVDFDPSTKVRQKNGKFRCNYILQIFSTPMDDRPTLFFEIIQRYNHNGFGKGTFKGLFESIEEQQKLRGTLTPR